MKNVRYAAQSSAVLIVFAVSLFLLGQTAAVAETPVDRTGVFLLEAATPRCDDITTGIQQGASYVADHAKKLGEAYIKNLEGDPHALIDEINSEFKDLGNMAATLSKYTPLALATVVADALPAGKVGDFIKKGVDLQNQLRASVASKLVEGMNPLETPEALIIDLKEYSADFGNVINNLDDPKSAANEFLKMQQKWTGAGALTYVLTEKNPSDGIKKALQAMHHQVKVATDLGAGPEGKVSEAVLGVVMDESKKYLGAIKDDPAHKKAAGALMVSFLASYHRARHDPEIMKSQLSSRHPFYFAEIREVNLAWHGDDHNSGGTYDWGLEHPVVEDKPGCISLSDYAYPTHSGPSTMPVVCGVEDGRDKWWSRPIDYERVWGDNCSGATHSRSIWAPVCKKGFVAVGFASSNSSSTKPLPNAIACLKDDPNLLTVTDGTTAKLHWIANDENSGAKYDVTTYSRWFDQLWVMSAVPQDRGSSDLSFVQQQLVAVPVAGGPLNDNEAYCVSFFNEPNYNGRTYQLCPGIGEHEVMYNNWVAPYDNIYSIRCGDGIAAVRLRDDDDETYNIPCEAASYLGVTNSGTKIGTDHFHANTVEILTNYHDKKLNRTIYSPLGKEWLSRFNECETNDRGSDCFKKAELYHTRNILFPQDWAKAAALYEKACKENFQPACTRLVTISEKRCKMAKDTCVQYGYLFETGTGMEKSLREARKYYQIACDGYNGDGCRYWAELIPGEEPETRLGLYKKGCGYDSARSCMQAGDYSRIVNRPEDAKEFYQRACGLGIEEGCERGLE